MHAYWQKGSSPIKWLTVAACDIVEHKWKSSLKRYFSTSKHEKAKRNREVWEWNKQDFEREIELNLLKCFVQCFPPLM